MLKWNNEIPDITNLATKAALNTKATEIKNKIRDTAGFITTLEFNKLTKLSFHARMKQARSLANKLEQTLLLT